MCRVGGLSGTWLRNIDVVHMTDEGQKTKTLSKINV